MCHLLSRISSDLQVIILPCLRRFVPCAACCHHVSLAFCKVSRRPTALSASLSFVFHELGAQAGPNQIYDHNSKNPAEPAPQIWAGPSGTDLCETRTMLVLLSVSGLHFFSSPKVRQECVHGQWTGDGRPAMWSLAKLELELSQDSSSSPLATGGRCGMTKTLGTPESYNILQSVPIRSRRHRGASLDLVSSLRPSIPPTQGLIVPPCGGAVLVLIAYRVYLALNLPPWSCAPGAHTLCLSHERAILPVVHRQSPVAIPAP
jgi:hypothetical protein